MKTGNIEPVVRAVKLLKGSLLKEEEQASRVQVRPQPSTEQLSSCPLGRHGCGSLQARKQIRISPGVFLVVLPVLPHVTVDQGVKDYHWAKESSGLPFWDVLLIENLPRVLPCL